MTDTASREARALRKFVVAFDVSGGVGATIPNVLHDAYLEAKIALADEAASQPREGVGRDDLYEMIDGFADIVSINEEQRRKMRGRVRAYCAMAEARAPLHDTAPTDQAQRGEAKYGHRMLAARGWFPSAGSVPYSVARELIDAALVQSGDPS